MNEADEIRSSRRNIGKLLVGAAAAAKLMAKKEMDTVYHLHMIDWMDDAAADRAMSGDIDDALHTEHQGTFRTLEAAKKAVAEFDKFGTKWVPHGDELIGTPLDKNGVPDEAIPNTYKITKSFIK